MKGMFGDSDLAGSLAVSQPKGRVYLKADLTTRSLNIIDAGPFVGYDPQRLDRMGTGGTIETVGGRPRVLPDAPLRSEEHTSELQSLMRISYAVFCLKKKNINNNQKQQTRILPN